MNPGLIASIPETNIKLGRLKRRVNRPGQCFGHLRPGIAIQPRLQPLAHRINPKKDRELRIRLQHGPFPVGARVPFENHTGCSSVHAPCLALLPYLSLRGNPSVWVHGGPQPSATDDAFKQLCRRIMHSQPQCLS